MWTSVGADHRSMQWMTCGLNSVTSVSLSKVQDPAQQDLHAMNKKNTVINKKLQSSTIKT